MSFNYLSPDAPLTQWCPEHKPGCPNHDPHQAAAVAEGFCPVHKIPLTPYEHHHPAIITDHWLWCPECHLGYSPLPHMMTGKTACSPTGSYCYWRLFQQAVRDAYAMPGPSAPSIPSQALQDPHTAV